MNDSMHDLLFNRLPPINAARCARWHTDGKWPTQKWLLATLGELGETANALKKLWRVEQNMANVSDDPSRHLDTIAKAVDQIADEISDTLIYFMLAVDSMNLICSVKSSNAKLYFYAAADRELILWRAMIHLGASEMNVAACRYFIDCMIAFADTFGIDLEQCIISKFNATSIKYNFPERLA